MVVKSRQEPMTKASFLADLYLKVNSLCFWKVADKLGGVQCGRHDDHMQIFFSSLCLQTQPRKKVSLPAREIS